MRCQEILEMVYNHTKEGWAQLEIYMAGIDYSKAKIQDREVFSFTKSALEKALRQIREWYPTLGCVIMSTCNRTELWLSGRQISPAELLCRLKGVSWEKYRSYFRSREGMAAVEYLMELTCGFHSQIFGEDQILTQIKQSIAVSRKTGLADTVLEVLFRNAVTAAKRVKCQTKFISLNRSMAVSAVELLNGHFSTLRQLPCLVIGNGEMGRLAAEELVRHGCNVTMTLRQYKTKDAVIPAGCDVIHYEQRIAFLKQVSVVISATLSPHYTLQAEEVEKSLPEDGLVFIDLAVPRDIDPKIAEQNQVTLYDVDQLGGKFRMEDSEELAKARKILQTFSLDFKNWYCFREWVPVIRQIGGMTAKDIAGRVRKELRQSVPDERERCQLKKTVVSASEKAVCRLFFGLREHLDQQNWENCIQAFLQTVQEDLE